VLERGLTEPQDASQSFIPSSSPRDSTFVTLNITASAVLACAAHSSGKLYLDIIKG
jgi:hypothetical protein